MKQTKSSKLKTVKYKGYEIKGPTTGGIFIISLNGKGIDTVKTVATGKTFIDRGYYPTANKNPKPATRANPEIMGRHVSESTLNSVFRELTQYYQSSTQDKKRELPGLISYLSITAGLSERQAKAYIGTMEKHLMPRCNPKPATRAAIAARVKTTKNPTITKDCKTLRQAERYQNLLYNKYNSVRLIHSPRFTEAGIYRWEVSGPIAKKNSTASDFRKYQSNKLAELGRTFQGEHNGQKHKLLQSDFTPNDKYRLGHLVQIKIKANGYTVPLNFDGDSMLSADLRNNLHIVGKDARINPTNLRQYGIKPPTKGNMTYLGKLVQFDYVTAKKHIENGVMTRYFHKPGEVTKELPNVFVDHDGFPHIVGGGYDVWDVGVVN